jgi:hypothetical protein
VGDGQALNDVCLLSHVVDVKATMAVSLDIGMATLPPMLL